MDLRRWLSRRPAHEAPGDGSARAGASLLDLAPGDVARVGSLDAGPARRLGRLSSFGIAPGARVKLIQKRPVVVIEIGGTRLALETDIAAEIRVGHPLPDA
jgi:Fe2+ transport system protein FeoA